MISCNPLLTLITLTLMALSSKSLPFSVAAQIIYTLLSTPLHSTHPQLSSYIVSDLESPTEWQSVIYRFLWTLPDKTHSIKIGCFPPQPINEDNPIPGILFCCAKTIFEDCLRLKLRPKACLRRRFQMRSIFVLKLRRKKGSKTFCVHRYRLKLWKKIRRHS